VPPGSFQVGLDFSTTEPIFPKNHRSKSRGWAKIREVKDSRGQKLALTPISQPFNIQSQPRMRGLPVVPILCEHRHH